MPRFRLFTQLAAFKDGGKQTIKRWFLVAVACGIVAGTVHSAAAQAPPAQGARPQSQAVVTQAYSLLYLPAGDTASKLRPLLRSAGANALVTVNARRNILEVTGDAGTQEMVAQWVQSVDRPPTGAPATRAPQNYTAGTVGQNGAYPVRQASNTEVTPGAYPAATYPTPYQDPGVQPYASREPRIAQAPAATPAAQPQPEAAAPTVKAHGVPLAKLNEFTTLLQQQYAGRDDVRISVDIRTRKVLVLAPAKVQRDIAAQAALITRQAGPPAPPARPEPAAAPAPFKQQSRTLKHIDAAELETTLTRVAGKRISFNVAASGRIGAAEIQSAARKGMTGRLSLDRQADKVSLEGPAPLVADWDRLIDSLDAPKTQGNAEILAVDYAEPEKIRQTAKILESISTRPNADEAVSAFRLANTTQPRRWGGDLVTMIFQQQPGAAQPGNPPAGGAPPAGAGAPPAGAAAPPAVGVVPGAPAGGDAGAIGPVRIEFVEGLDIIVLRGNQKDVDRVMRIIQDIERLSGETSPEIDIYHLQHAGSEQVAELVTELYDQILSSRQGTVSLRALTKPNALLMIGRRDTLDILTNLIRKVDQPVAPTTQFRVFQLRHMSSVDAQRRLAEFYQERTALGARVLVIPDYRTNSVIVQASPRDLLEVEALLKQIDVAESAATNEVRIFKLTNALAEELAPILQDAINGQHSGAGAGAGSQAATAQQGNQDNTTSQIRAAMLSFATVDKNGGQILKSGVLFDVRVNADTNSNSLIITAPKESMPLIEALVTALDQLPNASAQIKVFTILNGNAVNLTTLLQELFGAAGNQGGGANTAALLQAQQVAAGESSLVALRFAVDQRTNSIIVSGSEGDLAVVEAIIVRLDESEIETRKTVVYKLRNAPAADVSTAINQLLQGQRDITNLAPEALSPFEQIEREVIVVPELVSNSLIVSATPRYFDEVKAIVEELDARPPLVMIQVLIAEVSLGNITEFGIELGLQDSLLFDRGIGVVGFPFNQAALGNNADATSLGTRETLAGQALSNLSVGRTNAALGYGGLVLSAGNESINILLRALQDRQRMQVLSRPQVMTLDNQPAFVQVGARVPRITATTSNQNGVTNSVVLENVGILLGVTPRTSPDGLVVMEINAEKSQLGPEAQGIPIFTDNLGNVIRAPQINITTAQTTISARSGQTVVFAGLITKSKTHVTRGTPILSDIPVLGRLFRFDNDQEQRTELLIVMTPYIIKDEEDADWIKQVESERMSWCLGDVVEVHGDIGVTPPGSQHGHNAPQPQVIYPDLNPTGVPAPVGTGFPPGAMLQPGALPPGAVIQPDGLQYQNPVQGPAPGNGAVQTPRPVSPPMPQVVRDPQPAPAPQPQRQSPQPRPQQPTPAQPLPEPEGSRITPPFQPAQPQTSTKPSAADTLEKWTRQQLPQQAATDQRKVYSQTTVSYGKPPEKPGVTFAGGAAAAGAAQNSTVERSPYYQRNPAPAGGAQMQYSRPVANPSNVTPQNYNPQSYPQGATYQQGGQAYPAYR